MKKIIQVSGTDTNLYCLTEDGKVYKWEKGSANGIYYAGWVEIVETSTPKNLQRRLPK